MASRDTITTLGTVEGAVSQCDRLSFSTTVARHLVHRRAVSEVLLTDWCQTGADAFVCAAQWSRSHSFYRIRQGRHDPLLLAETIRQVGLLLCHEAYQMPAEYRFLMERMFYDADLDGLKAGGAPAEIVLVVRAHPSLRRTTPSARALRVEVEFLRGKALIGRGTGWVRCLAPRLYQRIRSPWCPCVAGRDQQPAPLPPAHVGLLEAEDVVLGHCRHPGEWPLRILTDHPVLFDHPLDHVPGMLVLEGMRQASRAILGWPQAALTTCDISFSRFIDLDVPSLVRVSVRQQAATCAALLLGLTQAGYTAAQGSGTLTTALRETTMPDLVPPSTRWAATTQPDPCSPLCGAGLAAATLRK
jgi:2-oxo-3-(phosphooxy)propyl 3-oxoalkanoate synthase